MTLDTRAAQADPARPAPRWLLVSPDDQVGRRLAARLGMTPETTPGGGRFVSGASSTAALTPGEGERALAAVDAVVYRPPRRRGSPEQPDLAAAAAFFAAFAQAYGDGGGGAGG